MRKSKTKKETVDNLGITKDICFSIEAKLEFNISEYGLSVIANTEGYLALARFCTFMAELHSNISADAPDFESGVYELGRYLPREAIQEGRFIFSPGPIKQMQPDDDECVQDVFFNVSDKIGPDYWGGSVESGSAQDWLAQYAPIVEVDFNEIARKIIDENTGLSAHELTEIFKEKLRNNVEGGDEFDGSIQEDAEQVYSVNWEVSRRNRAHFSSVKIIKGPEGSLIVEAG